MAMAIELDGIFVLYYTSHDMHLANTSPFTLLTTDPVTSPVWRQRWLHQTYGCLTFISFAKPLANTRDHLSLLWLFTLELLVFAEISELLDMLLGLF